MKVKLYFDVYPGVDLKSVYAYSIPSPKMKGWTRYLVEVEVPDPNDAEVDHVVLGTAKLVEEENDDVT